jgi:hypothetical protein
LSGIRLVLIQRFAFGVPVINPSHAALNLGCIGLDATAMHDSDSSTIAVDTIRIDSRLLAVTEVRQGLFRASAEGLRLLGCINLGHPDFDLPTHTTD